MTCASLQSRVSFQAAQDQYMVENLPDERISKHVNFWYTWEPEPIIMIGNISVQFEAPKSLVAASTNFIRLKCADFFPF